MEFWINSGHLVEAILVLTGAEWLGLAAYHRWTGHGPAPIEAGSMLLPGVCLLAALRSALVGSSWLWIAAALTAALFTHLADLARRWHR